MVYKEEKCKPMKENISPPIGKPIYGFAYERDQYSTSLRCKPVLGKVLPIYEDEIDSYVYSSRFKFKEFKKDGKTFKSGQVYGYSRSYADTYEEAAKEYNALILEHIHALEEFIEELKKDLIEL